MLSILPPLALPVSTYALPLLSTQTPISVDLLSFAIRLLPSQLHDRLNLIPPSLLADLLVTVLGIDWDLRVELLGIPDLEERGLRIKEILSGMMANRGITLPEVNPIESVSSRSIRSPPTTQRTASDLASQPQVPEDLRSLQSTFNRRLSELPSAVQQTITRELVRLVKIPPQSAEYGVGKTYLEWLLALPWKRLSTISESLDLDEARSRLEAEHEGLEGVKRRVIEYLAVYRYVDRTKHCAPLTK